MVSYGLLAFSLALIIGRKFRRGIGMAHRRLPLRGDRAGAPGWITVENLFILFSLTDPAGSRHLWAIAHSHRGR